MAGRVPGRQINTGLLNSIGSTGESSTIMSDSISINCYGYNENDIETLIPAIKKAREDFKNKRYGTIYIPRTKLYPYSVSIKYSVDQFENLRENFITENYRYPSNNESRPYVDEPWVEGDIITSTKHQVGKPVEWVCITGGVPGLWQGSGFLTSYMGQIERLNELPKPSVNQEGRQVIISSRNDGAVWTCVRTPKGKYQWVAPTILAGTQDEKPTKPHERFVFFDVGKNRFEMFENNKWREIYSLSDQFKDYMNEVIDKIKDVVDLLEEITGEFIDAGLDDTDKPYGNSRKNHLVQMIFEKGTIPEGGLLLSLYGKGTVSQIKLFSRNENLDYKVYTDGHLMPTLENITYYKFKRTFKIFLNPYSKQEILIANPKGKDFYLQNEDLNEKNISLSLIFDKEGGLF